MRIPNLTPSLEDFLKLTKKGNVIPVYREINADLDTPVSAFLKIKKSDYAFLLESVEGQEKIARYSFLGSNPSLVFISKGKNMEVSYPHKRKIRRFITNTTPLDEIKKEFEYIPVEEITGEDDFLDDGEEILLDKNWSGGGKLKMVTEDFTSEEEKIIDNLDRKEIINSESDEGEWILDVRLDSEEPLEKSFTYFADVEEGAGAEIKIYWEEGERFLSFD